MKQVGRFRQWMKVNGLVVVLAAWLAPSHAADITIRVSHKDQGQRLAGVAVCLGTSADPHQFGAFRTAANGEVSFENLPRNAHLLTVSREGFRGIARLLDVMDVERVILIDLTRGGGGPVCDAPREISQARESEGPVVMSLRINRGAARTTARRVTLDYVIKGGVTQYRASESADFAGASWQALTTAPGFELSPGRGKKRIYFQVRRYVELGDSSLESVSSVISDAIWLD